MKERTCLGKNRPGQEWTWAKMDQGKNEEWTWAKMDQGKHGEWTWARTTLSRLYCPLFALVFKNRSGQDNDMARMASSPFFKSRLRCSVFKNRPEEEQVWAITGMGKNRPEQEQVWAG